MSFLLLTLITSGACVGLSFSSIYNCPCFFNSLIKSTGKQIRGSKCKNFLSSEQKSFRKDIRKTIKNNPFEKSFSQSKEKEIDLLGTISKPLIQDLERLFTGNKNGGFKCLITYGNNKKQVDCEIKYINYNKPQIPLWVLTSKNAKNVATVKNAQELFKYSFYKIKIQSKDFPEENYQDFSSVLIMSPKNKVVAEMEVITKLLNSIPVEGFGQYFVGRYTGQNVSLGSFKCHRITTDRDSMDCKIAKISNSESKNSKTIKESTDPYKLSFDSSISTLEKGWYIVRYGQEVEYTNLKDEKIVLIQMKAPWTNQYELTNLGAYYKSDSQKRIQEIAIVNP